MYINCPECNHKLYYLRIICSKCGYLFYEKLNRTSPYYLNELANDLIVKLNKKFNNIFEERIIELLYIISRKSMSTYQLSLTYKNFGDCYLKYEMTEEAIACYESGLKLNGALPVKRKIKELKSLF